MHSFLLSTDFESTLSGRGARLRLLALAFVLAMPLIDASSAKAEYRVFELAITNTKTGKTRKVISNLDDLQYPSYHHLSPDETLAIQDSWMCWKRSENFKPYCPNPRSPASLPTTSSDALNPSAPSVR